MKDLNKKDGFCRAPRIEMVNENSRFEDLDFNQLLSISQFGLESEENMNIVRSLAKNKE